VLQEASDKDICTNKYLSVYIWCFVRLEKAVPEIYRNTLPYGQENCVSPNPENLVMAFLEKAERTANSYFSECFVKIKVLTDTTFYPPTSIINSKNITYSILIIIIARLLYYSISNMKKILKLLKTILTVKILT